MTNKKKLLVFFSFILLASTPSLFADGLGVGIHGGLNFAQNSVTPGVSSNTETKPLFGAHATIPFLMGWVIVPEVLYKDRGAKYFSLPILARWYLIPGPIKPFITFGPEFAFAASDKETTKSVDILLDGGAGVNFSVTSCIDIFAMGRYSFGLTNTTSVTNVTAKTRDLQVLAGVTFALMP